MGSFRMLSIRGVTTTSMRSRLWCGGRENGDIRLCLYCLLVFPGPVPISGVKLGEESCEPREIVETLEMSTTSNDGVW